MGEGWRGGVRRERVSGVFGGGGRRGVCSVGKEFRWGNMCVCFMMAGLWLWRRRRRLCRCGLGVGYVRVCHVVSMYVPAAVLQRYVTFSD